MSRINQRLVAEDGVQIHASTRHTSLPDPDSVLLYQHEDLLACHSQNNPTQKFVVEEIPPCSSRPVYTSVHEMTQLLWSTPPTIPRLTSCYRMMPTLVKKSPLWTPPQNLSQIPYEWRQSTIYLFKMIPMYSCSPMGYLLPFCSPGPNGKSCRWLPGLYRNKSWGHGGGEGWVG